MVNLLQSSPDEFVQFLKNNALSVFTSSIVKMSVALLILSYNHFAIFLTVTGETTNNHEGIFFELLEEYDILQGAFVHRTCRGQGAGGTRFWSYDTTEDFLRDGLRLSKGMTHKKCFGRSMVGRRKRCNC